MERVRVRGIYSTALTNLLQAQNFSIVQPSRKIQERFGLAASFEPFDLEIKDNEEAQGIIAAGPSALTQKLERLFNETLPDVITHRIKYPLHSIYWGLVKSTQRSGYVVDLGGEVGFLPHSKEARAVRPGEAILVQVCDLAASGKHLILTMELSLPGQRAVLSSQGAMRVSREIESEAERARLLNTGRRYLPSGWGVIWRTAAYDCPERVLTEEIKKLASYVERLQDHPDDGIPGRLLSFEATTQFEFPGGTKRQLDELRNAITPTLPGHHQYKAAGFFKRVDRDESRSPEALTEPNGAHHTNGHELEFPDVGQTLLIEHIKPDGERIILGRGRVIASDAKQKKIKLEREIRGEGFYDGLSAVKALGDNALTEFCEGAWEYHTAYYSDKKSLKGIYANVNTPIEIYPDRVRYVDLEIDVTCDPRGTIQVLDQEKIDTALRSGYIGPSLAARAKQTAAHLEAELAAKLSV
jgi:Ribonuclease G/E